MQLMVTSHKDPRIEFPTRLHEALTAAGFPAEGSGRQQALAKLLKVSQQAAGKWLRGESLPELARVIEIALATGYTVEWLLTARGPKVALRADESVRMDKDGAVTVLKYKEGSDGAAARQAVVAAEPASIFQVARQDPDLVLDVIEGAIRPFGLAFEPGTSIDPVRGLVVKAKWQKHRPRRYYDFGTHTRLEDDEAGDKSA